MAAIVVRVTEALIADPPISIRVIGLVGCEGSTDRHEWVVEMPLASSADDINKASVAAALLVLSAAGHSVGSSDAKRLFGGALPNLS